LTSNPKVVCLCCTYGRVILLGEAIKCFIDQDYDNKELIVLNDQEGVELVLEDCPSNVTIFNHSKRFNSLGEKRNYIKTLSDADYYCIWDDDDLYMPYRISKSVKNMDNCDIVKANKAIITTHNASPQIAQNLFHSQACVTKEYMDRCKYPKKSVGEDIDFENGANVKSIDVLPFYVYRWGLNIHHLSGIADDKKSWERSLTYYENKSGVTIIKPEFTEDHWGKIGKFLKNKDWEEKMKKALDKDS